MGCVWFPYGFAPYIRGVRWAFTKSADLHKFMRPVGQARGCRVRHRCTLRVFWTGAERNPLAGFGVGDYPFAKDKRQASAARMRIGRMVRTGLRSFALCLGLVACVPAAGTGPAAVAGRQIKAQSVLGGAITVAAPPGYCIDPAAVLQQADSAIVLIGRCAAAPGKQRARAILTAAVGEAGTGLGVAGSGAELAAFFTSDQGRAALSRSGRARTVKVLEAVGSGEAFLIRLTDTSPNKDGPGQAESWRAVMALKGRLVSLTVTGTVDAPLDRNAGRTLLDAYVAAMRAANRG